MRPGDKVTGTGPFGTFYIRPTQREMIYIGGAAGVAPLRAYLFHLLETEGSARKISFWYGARSRQELFYEDYFLSLQAKHKNSTFRTALSAAKPEDDWAGKEGFTHDVAHAAYLKDHPSPQCIEFYLRGPLMMILACRRMLQELNVQPETWPMTSSRRFDARCVFASASHMPLHEAY